MTEDEGYEAHNRSEDIQERLVEFVREEIASMRSLGYTEEQIDYVKFKLNNEFRFWRAFLS